MIDIKGYENRYAITEDGQVYSYISKKFLKPCDDGEGYLYVNLFDSNGKRKNKKIHRIVAETFIPNLDNLPCVNHKDQNKSNNSISNLEWCSYEYNNNYKDRVEKVTEKNTNHPSMSKKIKCIDKKTGEEKIFLSINEASRYLGDVKKHSNIIACLNGRQKSAYGYYWIYV